MSSALLKPPSLKPLVAPYRAILHTIAAIPHIARYFFREVSTPPKWCDTPPWHLVSHRHICAIPHFATYRAIIVRYPTKTSAKEFCDTITASIARYEKYRYWASKLKPPFAEPPKILQNSLQISRKISLPNIKKNQQRASAGAQGEEMRASLFLSRRKIAMGRKVLHTSFLLFGTYFPNTQDICYTGLSGWNFFCVFRGAPITYFL